jgi:hypothetical protein
LAYAVFQFKKERKNKQSVSENAVNSNRSRLTVKELKSFPGLEEISDEEANESINSLEKYSFLLHDLFVKYKSNQYDK